MTSAFDPTTFLTQRHTQGADTRIPLHNPGDWRGAIGTNTDPERGDITFRLAEWTDKKTGQPRSQQTVEIWLYTDNAAAVPAGGISPTRCRFSMFLDLDDAGAPDMAKGKNRKLGTLLTAVGIQDKDGTMKVPEWGFADLYGKPLQYRVSHKPRSDNGEPQADVTMVAAIA